MKKLENLKIKIFSDGANIEDFIKLSSLPYIKGFTTNPSLMKKAGVKYYEAFIEDVMKVVKEKPVSFEVISDEFALMKKEAIKLQSYGDNVYVKIPIMNTKGESSIPLIRELAKEGVRMNITAIMTIKQVKELSKALKAEVPSIVSVFAGRIADTGINPIPVMEESKEILKDMKNAELLWASPRELLNIFQAEKIGCDIITVLPEILKKMRLIGYDLHMFSLDTVKMFYNDAVSSGLKL